MINTNTKSPGTMSLRQESIATIGAAREWWHNILGSLQLWEHRQQTIFSQNAESWPCVKYVYLYTIHVRYYDKLPMKRTPHFCVDKGTWDLQYPVLPTDRKTKNMQGCETYQTLDSDLPKELCCRFPLADHCAPESNSLPLQQHRTLKQQGLFV